MISLKSVSKVFEINKKNNIRIVALDDITLSFAQTGLVAVVGKSGSGKTTLLNLLGGIDKPSDGDIFYNGKSLNTYKESELNVYRNNDVSFIFQEFNLLNDYSVIENIRLACRLQGKSKDEVENNARLALESVSLSDLAERSIDSLSGGQQQRVAIARAIARDSKIILCDEPTGNLDSKTSSEIFELLKEISKERLVIVVTHDKDFATEYADRYIVLLDGKIIDDQNKSSSIAISSANISNNKRKYGGISFKDSMKMIVNNIKKSIFGNIIVLLLLIASIALTTVFTSLSMYDEQDALVNTLKHNNQGLIQITKYIDYPREEYDPVNKEYYIKHGPVLFYEDANMDDLDYLMDLTEGNADFYKSYFFNKNIQDFTESFIYTDRTAFSYDAYCFREAVAIPDFDKLNMKLKYGTMPQNDDEILIYDYMANSMINLGVCEGNMSGLIGQLLEDSDTGLSMTIAGILSSDYEVYSYIKKDSNAHEFEETYLTSLQTIFCFPSFINNLLEESSFSSIYKCYYIDNANNLFDTKIKKLKNISLDGLNFIASIDGYKEERGVVVDRQLVADILKLDVSQVTTNIANQFLNQFAVSGIKDYYDYSFERNYKSGFAYRIIGVVDNELDNDIMHWYTPNDDDLYMTNATFRQFYLSLGNNWDINKQILSKFKYQTHDNYFYIDNPDYYFESYTDYSSYGILIRDADSYLVKVQDFAQTIMIILICATVIGLFLYALLSIKKYNYKIGVLKSMGARNSNIVLIFGMQILLIALIAFLISVPVSFGIMASINSIFIGDINPNLVFFAIKPLSVGLILIFTFIAVGISISMPLLRLYFQTPISVIRKNNKK